MVSRSCMVENLSFMHRRWYFRILSNGTAKISMVKPFDFICGYCAVSFWYFIALAITVVTATQIHSGRGLINGSLANLYFAHSLVPLLERRLIFDPVTYEFKSHASTSRAGRGYLGHCELPSRQNEWTIHGETRGSTHPIPQSADCANSCFAPNINYM